MQTSIHAAKTQLSRLIEAALHGEEVIIARGSVPVVRLEPIRASGFRFGVMKEQLSEPPDFLEPLDGEALTEWDGD